MSYDLLIRGANVVSHEAVTVADVAVTGGQIAAVGDLAEAVAERSIEAEGAYLIPGVIDPHVHLTILPQAGDDEAQLKLIEGDLASESLAAAFGGVTTFLPMINLEGPYSPHISRLAEAIEQHSHVNAALTVVVSSKEHVAEIPELADQGVAAFKHFLNAYRRDQVIGSLLPIAEDDFFDSLTTLTELPGGGGLAMVHAEDADLIRLLEARRRQQDDGSDLKALAEARPPVCETIRMRYAAEAAATLGAQVYFCHCSACTSTATIKEYKERGADITAEAVIHTLTTDYDDWDSVGVWGKFSPPLRSPEERENLWRGLSEGVLEHVSSDHCTWNRTEKENGGGKFGSIWNAPPGISNGMEHLLPALVTWGIRQQRISWPELVALTSYNTANRFGLAGRKGRIEPGADADLVLLDPESFQVVDESFYHGRGRDLSIFWGERLYGRPSLTVVGGEVVQRDGVLEGKPGLGRFEAAVRGES